MSDVHCVNLIFFGVWLCAQAALSEISPIFVHDLILMDVPGSSRHSRGERINVSNMINSGSTLLYRGTKKVEKE